MAKRQSPPMAVILIGAVVGAFLFLVVRRLTGGALPGGPVGGAIGGAIGALVASIAHARYTGRGKG